MEGKDVLTIIALMLGPVIVAVFSLWCACTVGPPKRRRQDDRALAGASSFAQLAPQLQAYLRALPGARETLEKG
jgi:hypothetical protein